MKHPPPPTDVSLVFPPDPVWVRAAREAVRTVLTAAGRRDLTDTALLLTSEAVTNAVNACARNDCVTPVTLFAGWTDPHRLRVLVHDEAPGLPHCRTPGSEDEDGRGMQLISYGADAWGVCTHGPGRGKATWFELGLRR
ncbi:ATP-binding protein [Streptomyces sp. SYSU K217416]